MTTAVLLSDVLSALSRELDSVEWGLWKELPDHDGVTDLSDGARDKLLDLLAALGDNADQVAVSLAARQCAGRISDAIGCPVYRYLEDVLGVGDLEVLAVGADGIAVTEDGGMTSSNLLPPECVADFIERFDRREYPELVRPAGP